MSRKINNKEQIVKRLKEKQNNCCFYCWITLSNKKNATKATLEHLKPYCEVWNKTKFALACNKCNLLKGNISQELFEDWYICCNFKPWFDLPSYNKPVKVRWPIRWYNRLFPNLFNWTHNWKHYRITYKLYEQ